MVDLEVIAGTAGWSLSSMTVFKYLRHVLPAGYVAFALFAGLMPVLQQNLAVQTFEDVQF